MFRFENSPKKPTNLSLNASVLEAAREMGMNISQTVDELKYSRLYMISKEVFCQHLKPPAP